MLSSRGCDSIVNFVVSQWGKKWLEVIMGIWHFQMIGLPGIKCSFFFPQSQQSRVEGTGKYNYLRPKRAHHHLHSTHFHRSSRRGKVAGAANGKRELKEKKKKFVKLQTLQWVLSMTCGRVFIPPCQELRRKICDGQTKHNMQTNIDCTCSCLDLSVLIMQLKLYCELIGLWDFGIVIDMLIYKISNFSCISSTYHARQQTAWIKAGLLMRGASFVRL